MPKYFRSFFLFIFNMAIILLFNNAMAGELSVQRKNELHNLLVQDCGACHGMSLKGGLGPALTPDILKTRPRELIKTTILEGRAGTPMPPWKNILSQDDIHWLVETLYAGSTP